MKRNLLALASLAAAISTATAAVVADPQAGDLFLGFRASGGEGSDQSYLVKLGLDTSFSNAPGTSFTLNLGAIGVDLISVYGEDWFSRADLHWGVFGVRVTSQNPNATLYSSREQTVAGTLSTPYPALAIDARNSTGTEVTSVLTSIGGYRGRTATANSTVAAFQPNSVSGSASYNAQVATAGANDFGSLSGWTTIEGDFGNGAAGTKLDLYRFFGADPGVVQYRGTFSITEAGSVSYAVVPEPTTALLFVASTALLAGFARRRLQTV